MAQTKLNEEQLDLTNYKKAALTTAEIGEAVQTHNTAGDAHADIRTTLAGKAEQTDLEAHTADTDNPHSVTKAQLGLGNVDNTADADKPVSSAVQAALERKQDDDEFHPEDYGWPDIRPAARPNSIVLLAGVKADYSAYDNLGFAAECEGGYNVFIDGVQYGTTYASRSKCAITWSQYSATTGFPVSYPEELVAHIVQIVPAVVGNSIIECYGYRISQTGTENQGRLWIHINTREIFSGSQLTYRYASFRNPDLVAITAKDNRLTVNYLYGFTAGLENTFLEFVPELICADKANSYFTDNCILGAKVKKVKIKNLPSSVTYFNLCFAGARSLKKIQLDNCDTSGVEIFSRLHENCWSLEHLPCYDFTSAKDMRQFLVNAKELKDTFLDLSYAKNLNIFGAYGSAAYPVYGLKGVLFSSEAPFSGSSPQINLAYTGLDQAALVALFKSLPYNVGYDVVGNPTIQDGVVSGFSEENRIQISSNFSFSAKFELCGKFKTPSSYGNTGANEYIRSYNTNGYGMGIFLSPTGNLEWNIFRDSSKQVSINTDVILPTETDVWYKAIYDSQQFILKYSTDGINYITLGTNAMLPIDSFFTSGNRIGSNASYKPTGFFSEIIYLQEFNETVNGVPWFRGAAAMEKTINITGATGAAALTSEQLAIATDKGWTVTR